MSLSHFRQPIIININNNSNNTKTSQLKIMCFFHIISLLVQALNQTTCNNISDSSIIFCLLLRPNVNFTPIIIQHLVQCSLLTFTRFIGFTFIQIDFHIDQFGHQFMQLYCTHTINYILNYLQCGSVEIGSLLQNKFYVC